MNISFDKKLHKEGEFYQPKTVEKYINKSTKNILELGCGQGANLSYLASIYQNVKFTGIDLTPSIDKKISNVELISQFR